MAILKYIPTMLLPLLLAGCYEDFTPDIDTRPVLCLNSIITAGEPIEVDVSRTWLYTDEAGESNHSVTDAVVSIYANDALVGEDYLPQEGDTIRIVAESKAYGHAQAEVIVPVSAHIGQVDWEAEVTDSWEYDHGNLFSRSYRLRIKAKLKVDDPAADENYYQFAYFGFPEYEEPDPDVSYWQPMEFYPGTFKYEAEPIFAEHIGVFEAITGASDAYGFTLFTDRQFSGKSYTLNLQFADASYMIRDVEYDVELVDCGYVLTLCTVSKSLYNWCVYRWNVDSGFVSDFGDMGLGDPVWGYSNVSTGAGVVAAQSLATYTINLSDFLTNQIYPEK